MGVDPMGRGVGQSAVRLLVNLIERYLRVGERETAARAALNMYEHFVELGQHIEPLAAENMSHWLAGSGRTKLYSAADTWGAITDTSHADRSPSPKLQVEVRLCNLLKDKESGTGWLIPRASITATKGEYYHAFGTFSIRFAGSYTEISDDVWELDGMWQLRDEYNWHDGLDAEVLGVTIKDEYALLVEEFHGAKKYNQLGLAQRKMSLDCCAILEEAKAFLDSLDEDAGADNEGRDDEGR